MRLKSVFEIENNPDLHAEYQEVYSNLKKKYLKTDEHGISFFPLREMFEDYQINPSYAQTTYTGRIKDGIELTELELSMICDNGFSHFGGSSTIHPDRTFVVEIYTD
jgi:hypothetical protein